MKIKALVEKRNAKQVELDAILELATNETRGLTQDEEANFDAIEKEIEGLNKTIELAEARAKETGIQVEVAKEKNEEKEERDMEFTQEMEDRAIAQYIRGQEGEELRAMVTDSAQTGTKSGAIVPTHLSTNVIKLLNEVAPLFSMIPKLTPVNGTLEILKETNIGGAGFVGEMKNITANDFTMEKVKLEQRRAGSAVELSQHLINDAGIDIVSYTKDVLFRRLGYALDMAVVDGNKDTSFEGLLSVADTCKVDALSSAITIDDFMNVMNAMHPTLQQGAVWIMSRKLFNQVALLKDGNGDYYMTRQLNVVDNKPEYRLFGHKIFIHEGIPTEEVVGTKCCFFVNFAKAYAGMVKKNIEMKHINQDTLNALRGSHTFTLDIYADVKIVDDRAIKYLAKKAQA